MDVNESVILPTYFLEDALRDPVLSPMFCVDGQDKVNAMFLRIFQWCSSLEMISPEEIHDLYVHHKRIGVGQVHIQQFIVCLKAAYARLSDQKRPPALLQKVFKVADVLMKHDLCCVGPILETLLLEMKAEPIDRARVTALIEDLGCILSHANGCVARKSSLSGKI